MRHHHRGSKPGLGARAAPVAPLHSQIKTSFLCVKDCHSLAGCTSYLWCEVLLKKIFRNWQKYLWNYDIFLGEILASNLLNKTCRNIFIEKDIQIWLFYRFFGLIVPASSYTGRDVHSHVISCCSLGPWAPKRKGGGACPPILGRSVSPITNRRVRLFPPHFYWHPRIFRPSYGPRLVEEYMEYHPT